MSASPQILVAIDLTTRPDHICQTAAGFASRLGADVTLLTVVSMPSGVPGDAVVEVEGRTGPLPAIHALEKDALEHLARLRACFAERGVKASVSTRPGAVVDTIVACADDIDALFIVVGADVPSGLRRFVTQGFTASIVKASARPVLVVPPSEEESMRGRTVAQAQVAAEADG